MSVKLEQFRDESIRLVPLAKKLGFVAESLGDGQCVVRAVYTDDFLRPGGTISGPVLMALADYAMWGAIMSKAKEVHMALTTSLNINFMIRPQPGDIVAVAKIMKLGKRLAVGTVDLFGNDEKELVAHVTCTYSLPPKQQYEEDRS